MISRLEKSKMRSWQATVLMALVGLMGSSGAWAENTIRSITGSQQANGEVIRIELSEPLTAAPKGFAVQSPPRIAIDLPGVTNGMASSSVEVNQGNVRTVNLASAGDRTRLVLSLKQASAYRTEIKGKTLLIALESAPVAEAAAQPVHFATSQNAEQLAIRDIDFRRGPDGVGRIVVGLANTQVGVDLRQQGQSLVVEFLRSTLPDNLRRKLDVSDFGSPVQTISAVQSGDRVRLLVEPRGAWEHSAYQTDTQFVLEVRPVRMDPNKVVQGPGFQGEKLSLNFQNIEVRALLQVIADFTNFNVVTSDSVNGNVTLRLKDVPWDHALDIILQAKGLGMRKSGNVLWIAPKEELAAKEQVDLEAKRKLTELEQVRTQSFQLNYTKAEEVARSLLGQLGGSSGNNASRILSARGSLLFESRTNQLFVSDIASKLEEVAMMIAKIDVPVRQVLIEARIVEADDKFGRALGVKLGSTDMRGLRGGVPGYSVGNTQVNVGGNYNAVGYQTLQQTSDSAYSNTQFVNLPANSGNISTADAASVALSLFSASANRFLNLELTALEAEGKGKIVSSPRVITTDQTKAEVEQGVEIPYQIASSSGATAVTFKKASLRLEVTPQITPEGNVILALEVNKDSRGENTTAGPAINTKHVKTQVLVENGGTVVIGGIFTQDERQDVNKVPLLGDIPFLGNLFKDTVRYSNRTELLVFITPKIVSDRSAAR
ncbi:type IV pilus secretin PilQ [Ideonella sp.]|uniref:type IV pilus secretin PilQ n=1 Tax=Ideonella sp. TaxID=1929293 RepID=UPI003BB4E2AF